MTTSLCNVCYREIPAYVVYQNGNVVLHKFCENHGYFIGLVEKNVAFYDYWKNRDGDIYPGHLVDVTQRCNLNCQYCYYEKTDKDIPVESILDECRKAPGPYILTGGEPTLRTDLPEIIKSVSSIGPAYVLTNGTGFMDKDYLKRCNEYVHKRNGYSGFGLSYHGEFDRFPEVIQNLRAENIKIHTIFFVVDRLEQLPLVKEFAEANRNIFELVRIKCASKIWDQPRGSGLYASDVLDWFLTQGYIKYPPKGKTTYLPFWHNGVLYSVVTWYDIENVDLSVINCPPTYTAKNGETMDFVKAMLTNEGISKGWLKGERLDKKG